MSGGFRKRGFYYKTMLSDQRAEHFLCPDDYAFMERKLAAGVPLSSVAKMLGVRESVLNRKTCVDMDGSPSDCEERSAEQIAAGRAAYRKRRDDARIWRAPGHRRSTETAR